MDSIVLSITVYQQSTGNLKEDIVEKADFHRRIYNQFSLRHTRSVLPYQTQPVVKLFIIVHVKEAVSFFLSFVHHKNIFLRLNK